jgi:hypothetical protein
VIPLPPPASVPAASGTDDEDDKHDIKDEVKAEAGVVGDIAEEPETATMKAMRVSNSTSGLMYRY